MIVPAATITARLREFLSAISTGVLDSIIVAPKLERDFVIE
jgi:hypothetical protein